MELPRANEMSRQVLIFLLTLGCCHAAFSQSHSDAPEIVMWYGLSQDFGHPGKAQRWVNVLGNVSGLSPDGEVSYQINNGQSHPLTLGSDLHRLARTGDFNVELSWNDLQIGSNDLRISAIDPNGNQVSSRVFLNVHQGGIWPLPYSIDFSQVNRLQDVVQIADGLWKLTDDGVRTSEPYYDRVLMVGDTTWENYGALVKLTIHGWTPSEPGPPTYNVSHFGVAMRWRGHHKDGRQPSRKWFPLGAQGELLLRGDSSHWRVLFDGGNKDKPAKYADHINRVELDSQMLIRTEVVTLADGRSRYRFKQWMFGQKEPEAWDLEGLESNDYLSGALCLVPHNSEVTIHQLTVTPITAYH